MVKYTDTPTIPRPIALESKNLTSDFFRFQLVMEQRRGEVWSFILFNAIKLLVFHAYMAGLIKVSVGYAQSHKVDYKMHIRARAGLGDPVSLASARAVSGDDAHQSRHFRQYSAQSRRVRRPGPDRPPHRAATWRLAGGRSHKQSTLIG